MDQTQLYFLGEAALANGFRLAGFQVFPDATESQLDVLLKNLVESRQTAFVILDNTLYDSDLPILDEVRNEGGRILLSQVPSLQEPTAMHSPVEQRIALLLGQHGGSA